MKTLGVMVALLAAQAGAQPKTLKDFLANADEQNVDRRISLEQRQRAEAEFRAAWTGLLPSLAASATWTHNQFEAVANFPNPATGMVTKPPTPVAKPPTPAPATCLRITALIAASVEPVVSRAFSATTKAES